MTDDPVEQALAELHDLVRCRCHPAYTGRGLHDPDCECDSAEAVTIVADHIEAQAAEIERLRGDLAKAVEALQIARVHVANNAEGWSVSRAPSRDDLTIVDLVLAALTGDKP